VPAKLYVVPASHPCAAVMRALELKGVAYDRVDLLPVVHKAVQRARFGRPGTVPGLVLEDGTRILGSREIVAELERRAPEPPLFPADAGARRRVEEADEWGDQVLQPLVRRLAWAGLKRDTGAMLSYAAGAKMPLPRPFLKLGAKPVAAMASRLNSADDVTALADLKALPGHLDKIEDWMDEGVLGGESPNAADLQIGAAIRLLGTFGDLESMLADRRCVGLGRNGFAPCPGTIPAGTLPADWVPQAIA
jgi:glutathione S-transferase